jgi:hypothetical protein
LKLFKFQKGKQKNEQKKEKKEKNWGAPLIGPGPYAKHAGAPYYCALTRDA